MSETQVSQLSVSKDLASLLLKLKAAKISLKPPFTWTSGIKSPVYCDIRLLTGFVKERSQVVQHLVTAIKKRWKEPDVIAGTATAGISWAAFVAMEMQLPMVYVRPQPKGHGMKKMIEGYLEEGKNVVLVEDLFSTGESAIKSANALIQEGKCHVIGVISIMSWELSLIHI
eukprot:TRINITY_DN5386_c0_g1_i1.p1 TRINITY_DN5386_c0_g1~~TRINITY_DN5386_c0_g1_i1.p1  ORF type:complete len:171 (+),score=23.48 TRINITY_DN5386_c0_g1_i1:89-601(+)